MSSALSSIFLCYELWHGDNPSQQTVCASHVCLMWALQNARAISLYEQCARSSIFFYSELCDFDNPSQEDSGDDSQPRLDADQFSVQECGEQLGKVRICVGSCYRDTLNNNAMLLTILLGSSTICIVAELCPLNKGCS